ncbi:MAG: nitroreductase family protein [Ramlibacter sp.]
MSEPLPREHVSAYAPFFWPRGSTIQLPPRTAALQVDLVGLLDERQTRREFTRDLTEAELGDFLWLACRNRASRPSPFGFDQESRPHPSAGGMHPIHVLLARAQQEWHRYEPVEHALVQLPGTRMTAAHARQESAVLVPLNRGVLIALAAEPGKTAAKYDNPDSLVWRDAGTVLGYMSVVAEALGLTFCPLGLLGKRFVSDVVAGDPRIEATGLAILGAAAYASCS